MSLYKNEKKIEEKAFVINLLIILAKFYVGYINADKSLTLLYFTKIFEEFIRFCDKLRLSQLEKCKQDQNVSVSIHIFPDIHQAHGPMVSLTERQ